MATTVEASGVSTAPATLSSGLVSQATSNPAPLASVRSLPLGTDVPVSLTSSNSVPVPVPASASNLPSVVGAEVQKSPISATGSRSPVLAPLSGSDNKMNTGLVSTSRVVGSQVSPVPAQVLGSSTLQGAPSSALPTSPKGVGIVSPTPVSGGVPPRQVEYGVATIKAAESTGHLNSKDLPSHGAWTKPLFSSARETIGELVLKETHAPTNVFLTTNDWPTLRANSKENEQNYIPRHQFGMNHKKMSLQSSQKMFTNFQITKSSQNNISRLPRG